MSDYFFEAKSAGWVNEVNIVVKGEIGDTLDVKLESAKLTHDVRKTNHSRDYILLHDWYSIVDLEHQTKTVKAQFFAPLEMLAERLEAVGFYNGIPK